MEKGMVTHWNAGREKLYTVSLANGKHARLQISVQELPVMSDTSNRRSSKVVAQRIVIILDRPQYLGVVSPETQLSPSPM